MWITEEKLRKFIQSEMRETLLHGASLDSAIAALKDCFSVDNNGNIDVTNSNFELYIGSTVTKTADEREIAELKSLVSGLYGVLADHSAEELRRFGFLEEAVAPVGVFGGNRAPLTKGAIGTIIRNEVTRNLYHRVQTSLRSNFTRRKPNFTAEGFTIVRQFISYRLRRHDVLASQA